MLYQFEWRGPRLMNIRLRVCPKCMDRPFIFNKPIVYPPDPVPVMDPRIEPFTEDNAGTINPQPLPWPVPQIGPPVPMPPTPQYPVYVTPPTPILPPDIESEP